MKTNTLTINELKQRAERGLPEDIDYFMSRLDINENLAVLKMIDYALGLVASAKGRERIRHYLFQGTGIQRNYASLYFKRRGMFSLIDQAVRQGCIDHKQAYAK